MCKTWKKFWETRCCTNAATAESRDLSCGKNWQKSCLDFRSDAMSLQSSWPQKTCSPSEKLERLQVKFRCEERASCKEEVAHRHQASLDRRQGSVRSTGSRPGSALFCPSIQSRNPWMICSSSSE